MALLKGAGQEITSKDLVDLFQWYRLDPGKKAVSKVLLTRRLPAIGARGFAPRA